MKEKLKIHPRDNVAVCLKAQGEIPAGHKMALCDIPEGGEGIKRDLVLPYRAGPVQYSQGRMGAYAQPALGAARP